MARYLSADATATSGDEADPMEIFDSISDGVSSKDEFRIAVEKMHYVSSLFGCDRTLFGKT